MERTPTKLESLVGLGVCFLGSTACKVSALYWTVQEAATHVVEKTAPTSGEFFREIAFPVAMYATGEVLKGIYKRFASTANPNAE